MNTNRIALSLILSRLLFREIGVLRGWFLGPWPGPGSRSMKPPNTDRSHVQRLLLKKKKDSESSISGGIYNQTRLSIHLAVDCVEFGYMLRRRGLGVHFPSKRGCTPGGPHQPASFILTPVDSGVPPAAPRRPGLLRPDREMETPGLKFVIQRCSSSSFHVRFEYLWALRQNKTPDNQKVMKTTLRHP